MFKYYAPDANQWFLDTRSGQNLGFCISAATMLKQLRHVPQIKLEYIYEIESEVPLFKFNLLHEHCVRHTDLSKCPIKIGRKQCHTLNKQIEPD